MLLWNFIYPFDRWWRTRYNVPFGSNQHTAMRMSDIVFEYQQHVYVELGSHHRGEQQQENFDFDASPSKYIDTEGKEVEIINSGSTTVRQHITDAEFNSLDLTKFSDPEAVESLMQEARKTAY